MTKQCQGLKKTLFCKETLCAIILIHGTIFLREIHQWRIVPKNKMQNKIQI